MNLSKIALGVAGLVTAITFMHVTMVITGSSIATVLALVLYASSSAAFYLEGKKDGLSILDFFAREFANDAKEVETSQCDVTKTQSVLYHINANKPH